MRGTAFSMGVLHCTHFFMMAAQLAQATRCRHGLNSTPASSSEHTRHSSIWGREGGREGEWDGGREGGREERTVREYHAYQALHCLEFPSSAGERTDVKTVASSNPIRNQIFLCLLPYN